MKVDGTNYQKSAGTSDTLTSDALDLDGYDGFAIAVLVNAMANTASLTFKLQHSKDNGSSDAYADVAGSSQVLATDQSDANKVILCDVFKPLKRYVKVILIRATANVTLDGVLALLHRADNEAVSQGSTVASSSPEFFQSPASGTA